MPPGAGGTFPGFGGAPPAVAGASAAGAAATASRSDHTHAGVISLNGSQGAMVATVDEGLDLDAATPGTLNFGQTSKATWPIATPRYYAVGTGGNDANAGFSDVSQAAAWAVRKLTIGGLAKIFPKMGAGRSAGIIIGGNSTTYTESLELLLFGTTGYAALAVRGTGTNATAGAVAGAGDAADFIGGGYVTGTGMNAAGYNPTGAPTTTSLPCLKVGGAAPAFAAEPAFPCGLRVRFDSATATAALRNVCRTTIRVTGTTTLIPSSAWPAVPAAGDVFYIEMPGWSAPATSLWHANRTLTINGGDLTGSVFLSGLTAVNNTFLAGCTLSGAVARNAAVTFTSTGTFPGMANATLGDCRGSSTFTSSNSAVSFGNSVWVGLVDMIGPSGCTMAQAFFAGGFQGSGGSLSLNEQNIGGSSNPTIGNLTGGAPTRFLRSASTALALTGFRCQLGQCTFVSGSAVGLSIRGMSDIVNMATIAAVQSSLVNESGTMTDVGVEFDNGNPASLSRFRQGQLTLPNASTLTGAGGDIRINGGFILTWAQINATGLVDTLGNQIASTCGPLGVVGKFSGVLITDVLLPTQTFLGDPGFQPLLNANGAPDAEYPTSLRIISRLRACTPTGTGLNLVVTLYKRAVGGALAATAQTVTIPAGAAAGATVADLVHPILFADGDTFAVLVAAAATAEGNKPLTVTLEGPC
jgi:hypothetical protein